MSALPRFPLEPIPTILRKIALTMALVAILSTGLYFGIMAIADRGADAGAPYWLTLVLLFPAQILIGRYIYDALKEGEVPVRFEAFAREEKPVSYWFTVGWSAVMLLLMLALSLYAIWHLT